MGKSRLVDEFSKTNFLIPINLRPKDARNPGRPSGFPPADHSVRSFLESANNDPDEESSGQKIKDRSFSRACHFLKALFVVTAETISKFDPINEAGCISKFRDFMSEGQSMQSPGPNRLNFYRTVVNMAAKSMTNDINKDEAALQITNAFKQLKDQLDQAHERCSESAIADANTMRVYIAFDDAHPLTMPFTQHSAESNLSQLRRALNLLRELPLFTFFLSTNGKISHFTPPRGHDVSEHMIKGYLHTPTPFIYLGFDQLMESRKIFDKYKTLEEVTSLDCMSLHRPHGKTFVGHNI